MNPLFKKRMLTYMTVMTAMVVPGSGHVLLGKPMRGFWMVMWMFAFGYITFQLTTPEISFIGRLSGGFAVWTISVLEAYSLACKHWKC